LFFTRITRLLTQLTKIDENSNGDMQEVEKETRLRLWVDVVGGMSRVQCYGIEIYLLTLDEVYFI